MLNKDSFVRNVRNTLHAFLSVTCSEIADEDSNYDKVVPAKIAQIIVMFLAILDDRCDQRRMESVAAFEKKYGCPILHELSDLKGERYAMEKTWDDDETPVSNNDGLPNYDWTDHDDTMRCFFSSAVAEYIGDRFMQMSVDSLPSCEFSSDSFSYDFLDTIIPKYKELMEIIPEDGRFYAVIMFPILQSALQMESFTFADDPGDFADITWRELYSRIQMDIGVIRTNMPIMLGKELYEMFSNAFGKFDLERDVPTDRVFLYRSESVYI